MRASGKLRNSALIECATAHEAAVLFELREHLKLVGRHGFAPCSIRVRAGASLSKFATRTRREGGVEPPRPGL